LNERILFNQEVGLEACAVPRQLIFNFTSETSDQDLLFYVNPTDTCGNSTDTLKGFWFVPATITPQTPIDTVVFVWEDTDTAYFQIDDLNPESLNISSFFKRDSLKESFSQFTPVEEDSPVEEDND
jgi:hypothetical protein